MKKNKLLNSFKIIVFLKQDFFELNLFEFESNIKVFFNFKKRKIDNFIYEYYLEFKESNEHFLNSALEKFYIVVKRLAGIKHVGFLIDNIKDLNDIDFFKSKTFIIRTNYNKEKETARVVYNKFKFKFSLKPDFYIKFIKINKLDSIEEKAKYCFIDVKRPNFSNFDPKYWKCNHPSAMKSKLARIIVNLCASYNNEIILDPFCGAGGLLIEASRLGLNITGIDINKDQVERAKKNIHFFKLKLKSIPKIIQGDALDLNLLKKINPHYIITDLPYGKSTYVSTNLKELYEGFIKVIKKLSDLNLKKAIIITPHFINFNKILEVHNLKGNLEFQYIIKIHKGLSRIINVIKF